MPQIPIIMPQLGESIAEATIVNFLVQPLGVLDLRMTLRVGRSKPLVEKLRASFIASGILREFVQGDPDLPQSGKSYQ